MDKSGFRLDGKKKKGVRIGLRNTVLARRCLQVCVLRCFP